MKLLKRPLLEQKQQSWIFWRKMIREAGYQPSFKNYKTPDDKIPYPGSLCVSINEEVVHGIPGERVLKDGDVVSFDLGMNTKDFIPIRL